MYATRAFGLVLAVALLVSAGVASGQTPMGTAFTYQGKLTDGGSPATGQYDFEFKLCDDPVAACTLATTTVEDEQVDGGLFTVEIDFGADVFTGEARWLELGVRPGASSGADPYTTLTPRQELTPSPHALRAKTGVGGPDALNVTTDDKVGIATDTPAYPLDVRTDSESRAIHGENTRSSGDNYGVSGLADADGGHQHGVYGEAHLNTTLAHRAHGVRGYADANDSAGSAADAYGGSFGAAADGDAYGVYGSGWTDTNTAYGVYGRALGSGAGTTAYGLYGTASGAETNWAGYFDGDVKATGTITSGSSITIDGTPGSENINSTGDLDLQTGGTSRLFIESTGKVGIGTNSPGVARLDVRTDSEIVAIRAENTKSSGTNYTMEVVADADGGDQAAVVARAHVNSTSGYYATGVAGSGYANESAGSAASARGGSFGASADGYAWGVYAYGLTDTATAYGVYGRGLGSGTGTTAYGLYGTASGGETNWAGYFDGDGYFSGEVGIGTDAPSYKLDVRTDSESRAIHAENTTVSGDNYGIYGKADADGGSQYGVYGEAHLNTTGEYAACGVYGYGDGNDSAGSTADALGGYFEAWGDDWGVGVNAEGHTDTYEAYGVRARGSGAGIFHPGTTAYGIYARADNGETSYAGYFTGSGFGPGTTAYGIYAKADLGATNYAGYFFGNVHVAGTLSKTAGSFKIDHPLDPENKYLYHSFIESPDMMNVYNGNVVLNRFGEATVEMPEWFEALNRDFRYQLTPIGAPGPNLYVAEEIHDNRFKIAGGKRGMKVSWQVTGIRQDAFANAHRIPVEENKPERERGRYLHPEAHGMSRELGVDYEHERKAELARMAVEREHVEHLPSEPQHVDSGEREGGAR